MLEKQIKMLQQKKADADQTGDWIVEEGKSYIKEKNESEMNLVKEKLATIKAVAVDIRVS